MIEKFNGFISIMKIFNWNVYCDITEEKYAHIKTFNSDIYILDECLYSTFDNIKSDWKYSLFYSDTLYKDDKAGYGIAVLSNSCEIKFTSIFNRNYRYIIPLEIRQNNFKFYLFAVWTKDTPIKYSQNILEALAFPSYKEYLLEGAIFLGDFNIPTTKDNTKDYEKILKRGLINCASKIDILKPTYSHSKDIQFYTADYCFATKSMLEHFTIDEKILDFDKNIKSKLKYQKLSDHVPLLIDIQLLK